MSNKPNDARIKDRKIKTSDFPKTIMGYMSRQHTVVLCERCSGIGFISKEELIDYHKREYATVHKACSSCMGDGRMIESVEQVEFDVKPFKSLMPYAEFHTFVSPNFHDTRWGRWRIDNRDEIMEKKYPDLAACSYAVYDELLEKYKLLEELKK